MIRIGVIGYVYWEANLVRSCCEAARVQNACVGDLGPDRLALLSNRYRSGKATLDFCVLIEGPSIDVVAIATRSPLPGKDP